MFYSWMDLVRKDERRCDQKRVTNEKTISGDLWIKTIPYSPYFSPRYATTCTLNRIDYKALLRLSSNITGQREVLRLIGSRGRLKRRQRRLKRRQQEGSSHRVST